jgi:hypothetical protein
MGAGEPGEAVGVAVAVSFGVAVGVAVSLGIGVGRSVALGAGRSVPVAAGVAEALTVAVVDGVAATVCAGSTRAALLTTIAPLMSVMKVNRRPVERITHIPTANPSR